MTAQTLRPRWKKKRWAAAGLALFAWYPISSGPYCYLTGRNAGWGFLGHDPMHRIGGYEPVVITFQAFDTFAGHFGWTPRLYSRWAKYNSECDYAGKRHRAAATPD